MLHSMVLRLVGSQLYKWSVLTQSKSIRMVLIMANVIAVIWDFDRTLVDGYMQDPIFKKYNVDAAKFWADMEADREK